VRISVEKVRWVLQAPENVIAQIRDTCECVLPAINWLHDFIMSAHLG